MAIVLALAVSGCSFATTKLDPAYNGKAEPECTDHYAFVVGDGLMAGIGIGVAVAGAEKEDALFTSIGALVGIGFGIAAIAGESNVDECKTAKTAWKVASAVKRSEE